MSHNITLTLNTALNLARTTADLVRSSDSNKKAFIQTLCTQDNCISLAMTSLVDITITDLQTYFQEAASNPVNAERLALIKTLAQNKDFMSSLTDEVFLNYITTLSKQLNNTHAVNAITTLLHFNPQRFTNPEVLNQVNWLLITLPLESQLTPAVRGLLQAPSINPDSPATISVLTRLTSMADSAEVFNDISNMNYSTLRAILIQDAQKTVTHKVAQHLSGLSAKDFNTAIEKLTDFKLYLFLINFEVWNLFQTKLAGFFQDNALSAIEIKVLSRVIKEISELPVNNILQLLSHNLVSLFDANTSAINNSKGLQQTLNAQLINLIKQNKLPQAIFLMNLMPLGFLTKPSITALMGYSETYCILGQQPQAKYQSYLDMYQLGNIVDTRINANVNAEATTNICKSKPDAALLSPCAELTETEFTTSVPSTPPAESHTHGEDAAPKAPGFSKSDTKPKAAAKPSLATQDSSKQDNMCKTLVAGCNDISSLLNIGGLVGAQFVAAQTTAKAVQMLSAGINGVCLLTVTAPCRWFEHISNDVTVAHAVGFGTQATAIIAGWVTDILSPALRQAHYPNIDPLVDAHTAVTAASVPALAATQNVGAVVQRLITEAQTAGVPGTQNTQGGGITQVMLHTVKAQQFLQPATQAAATAVNGVQILVDAVAHNRAIVEPAIEGFRCVLRDGNIVRESNNQAKFVLKLLSYATEAVSTACSTYIGYETFPEFTSNNTTLGEIQDVSGGQL